jgi:hypothetical protein
MKHDWSKEDYRAYRNKLCAESQKKRREKAKADGICVMCCCRPARQGMVTCRECSMRSASYTTKRRKEYMAQGMCLRCGKRPPMMYYKVCKECHDAAREYRAEYLERGKKRDD